MGEETRTRYHYCAKWMSGPGQETLMDGIVMLINPVQTMEDYKALKELLDADNAHRMTILSLTVLPNANSA